MTPTRWSRLVALVPDALALPTGERDAFLDRTCMHPDGTPDDALRAEATALVTAAADAETTGALASPVAGVARLEAPRPERIGPWRVMGTLGEGGMGVVYAAERAGDGFVQRAAVKRVRPGLRADFRARFLRERGLLAGLDHPGIARLLDGGVDADGAPYLAMEHVDGAPITTHAEAAGLDVPARVGLFLQACEAVAYAHRNLVVHRDLKPAHILVADVRPDDETAGRGARVTLLDFGIAKLIDADPDVLLTQTGTGPLTPQYAAPEQILGRRVTTATDVYALGLVLYELLAGARPYSLAGATPAEAERTVCETDPPPPSTVAPPERARALRGDLDMIVGKAMAKEPARRYPSAEALAADLQRHGAGLPVEARPATVRYRAGRFVRRHYGSLAVAAGAVLLIAALTAFYTVRLVEARDRSEAASVEARQETDRAEAVAGFLEQILRAPNTRWYNDAAATGPDTPIRAVLDEAARRVDRDFADRPEILADLHHLLGDTYASLELYDESVRHHRRTLALRESLYTAPDPRLAEAIYYVAATLGPRDIAAQVGMLERAVAMQRARNEGNNFPFMVTDLAGLYAELGRHAEAAALQAEGIAYVQARFVPGADGARYRDYLLTLLLQNRADALLHLDRPGAAVRTLAAADSVLARLPRTAAHHDVWRRQQCVAGRLRLRQRRFAGAEARLLACAGTGTPRAARSPFPEARAETDERTFRRPASADLVALYRAWGRPAEAAPYRADAARFHASRDSLRAAFQSPPAR